MRIRPATAVRGEVIIPGDKSISHRSAMISAMATGVTRIANYAPSADCFSTIECLEALGVKIDNDGEHLLVNGVGKTGFSAPVKQLDCGNSGTTMRLLSGILAGQPFASTVIGDDSLQRRPMGRIIDPLTKMGARIDSTDGSAPLTIRGSSPLNAIKYSLPVASAQIKSCILLAGLNSNGVTTVVENTPTRDHTERMLDWFGAAVDSSVVEGGTKISISGDAQLAARDFSVPSDISSAAFFIVAAACLEGSDITMHHIGYNETRRAVVDVVNDLGAAIEIFDLDEVCNEPVASLRVKGGIARSKTSETPILRGPVIANLIDEIPVLAILGTQMPDGLEIRDAGELRFKESDRVAAVVENLRRMGASVTEFPDGFRVENSRLSSATITPYGDHRIAMAFAIAGLLATGETEITDAGCADVSFPGFFDTLESAVER
ncbi:MAG: 3-phosphoshikimate 1-carboxyvinyltransferase [Pyrinomonadaceae bacterium]